jgi:hypothetical protein
MKDEDDSAGIVKPQGGDTKRMLSILCIRIRAPYPVAVATLTIPAGRLEVVKAERTANGGRRA